MFFEEACNKGSAFVKVAIVKEVIVGFVLCHTDFETALKWADRELTASLQTKHNAYIELIEVDLSHRRNGLGKMLLEGVEVEAKTRWKTKLWLHVRCSNKTAVSFYETLGWAVEELQCPQWMSGADVFLLSKQVL